MRWITILACLGALGLASCETGGTSKSPSAASTTTTAQTNEAAPRAAQQPSEPASDKAAPSPTESTPVATVPGAPALSQPPFTEGALQAEVTAMQQVRTVYFDAPDRSEAESNFALRVRIRGEQLKEVAKHGNLILTELVDDTGHSMLDDKLYTEEMKTMMRRMTTPEQRLSEFGLFVASRARPAAQGARRLARLRGTVQLILAGETRQITIVNPLQFYGDKIKDARLEELGLDVRIVSPDELEETVPGQCIVLQFKTKAEHVVGVNFHDAWMKPMLKRERPFKTKAGEACTGYCFQKAEFDDEMQLVLEVYPSIKKIELPVEAADIPLP